ncbi:MAG: AAA family ATPase, partial [Candidatus Limnocylindrales bacterium]
MTRSSPITVGRDGELARIEHAREVAATGIPVIVIVRGEAGIGKSRIVREVIERAAAAGSTILHGASLDLGGDGLPYLPIVEALRTLARTTPPDRLRDLLGPARSELAALLPELAAPAASDGERAPRLATSAESSVDRARLFERFLGFLGRLGEETPVVAVLEDVQWIDPATRDLVTFLTRNVSTERVVAILTCRTDDLAPGHPVLAWLGQIAGASGAVRIDLGRLTLDDVRHQLDAMAGRPIENDLAA